MDATGWIDLQEALIWFFGPVITQLVLVVFLAGGILSALGAVILGQAGGMAR